MVQNQNDGPLFMLWMVLATMGGCAAGAGQDFPCDADAWFGNALVYDPSNSSVRHGGDNPQRRTWCLPLCVRLDVCLQSSIATSRSSAEFSLKFSSAVNDNIYHVLHLQPCTVHMTFGTH
jgi:hypothetical protein